MKNLAQRAGLSLDTLYRYFPSKEYVVLAVALAWREATARAVLAEVPVGNTVRERVTRHLIREFNEVERERRSSTAALLQVLNSTGRSYSGIVETIEHLNMQILSHVAAPAGQVTVQQQRLLSAAIDVSRGATRRWLEGSYSAAEARSQIETGCELLELPDDVMDAELNRATPGVTIAG